MSEQRIEDILRTCSIRSIGVEPTAAIPSSTSLRDVIGKMQKRRVAAVTITNGGKLVGIFTERDVLNRIVGEALQDETPIAEVMTREPRTLLPDDRLADAIHLMTERGYRHIPLVDEDGRDLGILSARDIIEFIAAHFPKEVTNLPPELGQFPSRAEGG